jgi:hypothetical protein
MSNFVNVPADLSCKLFDTLIRPILLYSTLFEIRRTVGLSGQKITRTGNTAKYTGASVRQIFLCILFCTGNRKCNWYARTITVNSELDSVFNDIYFLNMQLFPW